MSVIIHWFRRDLRLTDNPSLASAATTPSRVLPVYVASSWKFRHRWTGPPRQQFLAACLESLAANIASKGGKLIIRSGNPVEVLADLARASGATAIHTNRAIDWHGIIEEQAVAAMAAKLGIGFHTFNDATLHEPAEILNGEGKPYRVYTPYAKVWMLRPKPAPRHQLPEFASPNTIPSDAVPQLDHWALTIPTATSIHEGGEKAARARMHGAITSVLPAYADRRDVPGGTTTSRLSQDLRFGLLSIRELYAKASAARESAPTATVRQGYQVFIQELAWREFYVQILRHFPHVLLDAFNPVYQGMPWDDDAEKLARWKSGQTGFPIVDAGMRQLLATGWMHNRLRMITAMFLTKDLHLDWRLGEQHFMQTLVDGEIASNNGGWQWSAGTGADAAPYFRIQNPWSQSKRHDPDGTYIKSWVPELRSVAVGRLHAPPDNGRPVATGYPAPMLDHAREREITLDAFKFQQQLKSSKGSAS